MTAFIILCVALFPVDHKADKYVSKAVITCSVVTIESNRFDSPPAITVAASVDALAVVVVVASVVVASVVVLLPILSKLLMELLTCTS